MNKLITSQNTDEIHKESLQDLNKLYLDKTMRTLSILMNQMNMMYYWEKIRLEYCDQEVFTVD